MRIDPRIKTLKTKIAFARATNLLIGVSDTPDVNKRTPAEIFETLRNAAKDMLKSHPPKPCPCHPDKTIRVTIEVVSQRQTIVLGMRFAITADCNLGEPLEAYPLQTLQGQLGSNRN